MTTPALPESIQDLALEPGDEGFDDACSLWNARFPRRPDVVVRCGSAADVAAAVSHAAENGMNLGVKGGGHSYSAATVPHGGMLLDLSPMKSIEVDLEGNRVTLGPGVTCGELDAGTQQHGLATPVPTASGVGVIGALQGGGSGWLSRKHGLTLDNLVSAEVVTSDGRLVEASEEDNPDLFWGLRGAGANLGVITSAVLRLHPVGPQVLAGQIIYPFAAIHDLLEAYRDVMTGAPRELQCFPFMFRVPPIEMFPSEFHGEPVIDFVVAHTDPDAQEAVAPLRDLGPRVLELVEPMPYTQLQQSFDANLPKGQRYYSKAHHLDVVSDGVISVFDEHVPSMAGEFTATYLEPLDGAVSDVDPTATAYAPRDANYGFHALGGWMSPDHDESVTSWVGGIFEAMDAHSTGSVYVNLIAEDGDDRIPSAYGNNYERVRSLKREWDPGNLFRHNHNIAPV